MFIRKILIVVLCLSYSALTQAQWSSIKTDDTIKQVLIAADTNTYYVLTATGVFSQTQKLLDTQIISEKTAVVADVSSDGVLSSETSTQLQNDWIDITHDLPDVSQAKQLLIVDNQLTLFSASPDTLYFYNNIRQSWQKQSLKLPDAIFGIGQLQTDPNNDKKLYAFGVDVGLHVSEDAGVEWQLIDNQIKFFSVKQIAFQPAGFYAINHKNQLYFGEDSTKIDLLTLPADDLQFIYTNNTQLYAIFGKSGLYRSADQGKTWTELDPNLSNEIQHIISGNNNNLYIADNQSILRSDDQGITWTLLDEQPEGEIQQLLLNTDALHVLTHSGLFQYNDIVSETEEETDKQLIEPVLISGGSGGSEPENITYPDKRPDLNAVIPNPITGNGRSLLDSINATLNAQAIDLAVAQGNDGILDVLSEGSDRPSFSFLPDPDQLAHLRQLHEQGEISVNPQGYFTIITTDGRFMVLIPAPHSPAGLLDLLKGDGIHVTIEQQGAVILRYQDSLRSGSNIHIVAGFDPHIDTAPSDQAAGIYTDQGVVVYEDGSQQNIHPIIPQPEALRLIARQQFDIHDLVFHANGSCDVFIGETKIVLNPTFETQTRQLNGAQQDSMVELHDGYFDYTIQDGDFALTTKILIHVP